MFSISFFQIFFTGTHFIAHEKGAPTWPHKIIKTKQTTYELCRSLYLDMSTLLLVVSWAVVLMGIAIYISNATDLAVLTGILVAIALGPVITNIFDYIFFWKNRLET